MKRSTALAPLSRDHQHALYVALRLRRAHPATLTDVIEQFRNFFADEGERHFQIEEELILPALPAEDAEWGPGIERVREDHAAIRAAEPATVEQAQDLGERLNDHVRFEERELFPILERRLSPEELARLGAAVEEAEGHQP